MIRTAFLTLCLFIVDNPFLKIRLQRIHPLTYDSLVVMSENCLFSPSSRAILPIPPNR